MAELQQAISDQFFTGADAVSGQARISMRIFRVRSWRRTRFTMIEEKSDAISV